MSWVKYVTHGCVKYGNWGIKLRQNTLSKLEPNKNCALWNALQLFSVENGQSWNCFAFMFYIYDNTKTL